MGEIEFEELSLSRVSDPENNNMPEYLPARPSSAGDARVGLEMTIHKSKNVLTVDTKSENEDPVIGALSDAELFNGPGYYLLSDLLDESKPENTIISRHTEHTLQKVASALRKLQDDTQFDSELTRLNLQMVFFSWSAAATVMIYLYLCFEDDHLYFSEYCETAIYYKALAWCLYLCFAQRCWEYYQCLARRRVKLMGYATTTQAFYNGLHKSFLREIVLNGLLPLPVPIPGVDMYVFILMSTRLYLGTRVIRDWSTTYSQRDNIANSSLLREYAKGYDLSVEFYDVIKIFYLRTPIVSICFVFLSAVMLLAYVVHVLEREFWWYDGGMVLTFQSSLYPAINGTYQYPWDHPPHASLDNDLWAKNPYHKFSNSLWFAVVTMTTVGYGDISPKSNPGRVVSGVGCMLGIVLTSVMAAVVIRNTEQTTIESEGMNRYLLTQSQSKMENAAARIIQKTFRISPLLKGLPREERIRRTIVKCREHIKMLKKQRKEKFEIKARIHRLVPLPVLVGNLLFQFTHKLQELRKKKHLYMEAEGMGLLNTFDDVDENKEPDNEKPDNETEQQENVEKEESKVE